jgi:hypothetical protein
MCQNNNGLEASFIDPVVCFGAVLTGLVINGFFKLNSPDGACKSPKIF